MPEENNWTKRNIADGSRVDEFVSLYESLGFEVKIEDFDPSKYPSECNECMIQSPSMFKVIYTRHAALGGKGLFDDE